METVDFCTKKELQILLAQTTNIKHRAQILLMSDAGLRVSEVTHLKWLDFDFRKRTLTVNSLKKRSAKGKTRTIPLSDRLYEVLAQLIEKHPPESKDAYLFSFHGKPVGRQSVNNTLKKLQQKAPELGNVHPHKLRHTFATNLRANDAQLEDIRDLLGHNKIDTTLIYAHATPELLREKINAAQPKKSLFRQVKDRLFPEKKKLINWVSIDSKLLVGRDQEVRQINEYVSRNISVILTGKIGVGKSQVLNSLKFEKKVLEIDDCKDFKKSLINILLYLFDNDKEIIATMLFPDLDKDKIATRVSKESLISLSKLICEVTQPYEYILRINDIDNITPSVVKTLEVLKNHFCILTTARTVKMANTSFMWNFERIEIKPLSRPDSIRLTYMLTQDLQPEDSEYLRNKVWDISEGNLRMIQELCDRFRKEPVLDNETIEDIYSNYVGKQTQEIDMSIYFLLFFGALAVLRYLSAEVDNPSLKFIGGCFMILLLFARYFFNSMRRKAI
jgi:hypothetical protein